MNEVINPPCKSSVATSCVESAISSSSDEKKTAAPFIEGVSSTTEGELAIDENASTVSLAINPCFVHDLSAAVQGRWECISEFLDHLSGGESASSHLVLGGEVFDIGGFVDIKSDIMSGRRCWMFAGRMFAEALERANLPVETLAEGVMKTYFLPTC